MLRRVHGNEVGKIQLSWIYGSVKAWANGNTVGRGKELMMLVHVHNVFELRDRPVSSKAWELIKVYGILFP